MSAIRPTKQQITDLINAPDEGPVVMLNLLKFKPRSGSSSYGQYGDAAVKMIEERGGKVVWVGKADQVLIGDASQDWDSVLLVQYPSRKSFIEMTSTNDYNKAHEHREAGLERTIVIACTPRIDNLGS